MAANRGTKTTHNAYIEGDQLEDAPAVAAPVTFETATPYDADPLVPMWWVRAYGVGVPYVPAPELEPEVEG